jgi:hypothetical protein
VHAVDEGLIFDHIVCRMEMKSINVNESITLGGDQNDASPAPLRVKEPLKYMLQCSRVTRAGGGCVSVHSDMKSTNVWDLIVIWGTYVMSSPVSSRAHLVILPVVRRFPTISLSRVT